MNTPDAALRSDPTRDEELTTPSTETRVSADRATTLRSIALLALACAGVAVAYSNALTVGLVWDDEHFVGEGSAVARYGISSEIFATSFWGSSDQPVGGDYYRPLTIVSFAIDHARGGGAPGPFHFTNIALHLLVCVALFLLGIRIGLDPPRAALAVLLFGLFPRATEAVTFISGRTDLLASLAVLIALVITCSASSDAITDSSSSGGRARLGHGPRILAAFTILLGLLSKEVALAGAAGIVAWTWSQRTPGRAGWRALAVDLTPIACAVGFYAALRISALEPAGSFAQWRLPIGERWIFSLQALAEYASMLVHPLSPHLYVGTLGVPQMQKIALGFVIAAGLILFFVCLVRGRIPSQPAALATTAIVALLLVIHLIPISLRAVAADRYLYLPVALSSLFVCAMVMKLPTRFAGAASVGLLACAVVMGSATHDRNALWNDELALWRETAKTMPAANGLADYEVGNVLARQGRSEDAIRSYLHAFNIEQEFIERYPDYISPVELLSNLGLVLSERGRIQEALPILQRLIVVYPNSALYHLHFGSALSRGLRFQRAEEVLARAEELDPGSPMIARMRGQNARAARIWKPLPEPADGEPIRIRAARAETYFQVGRLGEANALWLEILEAADASPDLIRRAARVLRQQREALGETEDVRQLAAALAQRTG